jgi:hypothetical protein
MDVRDRELRSSPTIDMLERPGTGERRIAQLMELLLKDVDEIRELRRY